jgi:GNAT superfamily N-acetyltransferase
MSNLVYKFDKVIDKTKLSELFATDGWTTAEYPNRLQKAINNSDTVVTAWDGDILVGLASAISDGFINMFVTYLIVRPEYQKRGIGTKLMEKLLAKYEGFGRQILTTSLSKTAKWYKQFGFNNDDPDAAAMFLNDWRNDDVEKEKK